MKVCITTLGCPKNTVDSAHLEEALRAEGFEPVEDPGQAGIMLVNTCGFIRDAKEESIDEILKLASIRKVPGSGSRVHCEDSERKGETAEGGTTGESKKLVVFGCLAQRYREELLREMPEIDALWGVDSREEIIEYCKALRDSQQAAETRELRAETGTRDPGPAGPDARRLTSSYAYLKIAEGCGKRCTFCVIPAIRGPFRSAGPEGLLAEARRHVRRGARELILVAQDITDYGRDLAGHSLVSLVRDIASLEGDFRIRLLYLYPTSVTDELLELIASEKKVIDYLDIPLQHSEDRLLRLMGRRGTRKEYLRLLRRARRAIPGVTLRTTFIVGFPSETEEEFQGLADFVEEARFDRLGAFTYSREEGTAAALLKGQVPEKAKQRRLDELMRRQALISLEKNRELVGRRFEALIEEVDGRLVIGRLASQAPEIDGVTIIEETVKSEESRVMSSESVAMSQESGVRNRGAGVRSQETRINRPDRLSGSSDSSPKGHLSLSVGDLVTVEIVDAYDYDLKARIVAGAAASGERRR